MLRLAEAGAPLPADAHSAIGAENIGPKNGCQLLNHSFNGATRAPAWARPSTFENRVLPLARGVGRVTPRAAPGRGLRPAEGCAPQGVAPAGGEISIRFATMRCVVGAAPDTRTTRGGSVHGRTAELGRARRGAYSAGARPAATCRCRTLMIFPWANHFVSVVAPGLDSALPPRSTPSTLAFLRWRAAVGTRRRRWPVVQEAERLEVKHRSTPKRVK